MMSNLQCGLASFVFFLYFYKHLSPALSWRIPKFNRLSNDEKLEWHCRNTSTLHAVIVSLLTTYVFLFDNDNLKKDIIWGRSLLSERSLAICVGYLLSDLYVIYEHYSSVGGSVGFIIHHCVSAYAYIYALTASILVPVANFRLLAEMSTPFVNLRWSLSIMDGKSSKSYYYNGLLLALTFFIVRVLPIPFFYYMVVRVQSYDSYRRVPYSAHISWISVCMILDVMNVLWFRKILSGALKHFYEVPKTEPSSRIVSNGNMCKSE